MIFQSNWTPESWYFGWSIMAYRTNGRLGKKGLTWYLDLGLGPWSMYWFSR